MDQEQMVESVVKRNLRPDFSPDTPEHFSMLAQACWNKSPNARPTFVDCVLLLNKMLHQIPPGS
eukprot:gene30670-35687_t